MNCLEQTRLREQLQKIACTILDLKSLETTNSDESDFQELAVWQIRKALETAYRAGVEDSKSQKQTLSTSQSFQTCEVYYKDLADRLEQEHAMLLEAYREVQGMEEIVLYNLLGDFNQLKEQVKRISKAVNDFQKEK